MGCFSSKFTNRSNSFRDELSQSLQRRINGFPMLDELLISKDGSDQLLALVCTANNVARKLHNGFVPPQSSTDAEQLAEHFDIETINTSELMVGLEEESKQGQSSSPNQKQGHDEQAENILTSIQQTLASGESAVPSRNFNTIASARDAGFLTRSRSFHTVEEYDEILRVSRTQNSGEANLFPEVGPYSERISILKIGKLIKSIENDSAHIRSRSFHVFEKHARNRWTEVATNAQAGGLKAGGEKLNSEAYESIPSMSSLESKHGGVVRMDGDSTTKDQYTTLETKEIPKISVEFDNVELQKTDSSESSICSSSIVNLGVNGDSPREDNFKFKRGLQRNLKIKELSALDIPSRTVDFPVVGSLGEWLEVEGQVFSSGDYVTPRFGNFNVPSSMKGKHDLAFFDPEMIAAFEEAMKELREEEECILQQIDGDMDVGCKIVKEGQ